MSVETAETTDDLAAVKRMLAYCFMECDRLGIKDAAELIELALLTVKDKNPPHERRRLLRRLSAPPSSILVGQRRKS
jgi:hypothetical protein